MMKKVLLTIVFVLVGTLAFSNNSTALPLEDILGDSFTHPVSGNVWENYNIEDSGNELYALNDNLIGSSGMLLTLNGELGKGESFGLYSRGDHTNKVMVFGEGMEVGKGITIQLLNDGTMRSIDLSALSEIDSSGNFDNKFGFYYTNNGNTFYSESLLNNDEDRVLTFDVSPMTNNGGEWVIAFDSDDMLDYNELLVQISGVDPIPTPEPLTMMLFGVGLGVVGFKGFGEKSST